MDLLLWRLIVKLIKMINKNKQNFKRRVKRAQTEIMGLMIIVVILSMIILFVVSVVFFKPKDDPLSSFIQKDLSTSIVSAMLKTDSGCTKDTTMEDLFIDAVRGNTITCKDEILSQTYYENPSCENIITGQDALNCGVSQILMPLQQMMRPYHFMVKAGPTFYFNESFRQGDFYGSKSMDVTPYTLPVYPTDKVLEIWLCIGGECPNI